MKESDFDKLNQKIQSLRRDFNQFSKAVTNWYREDREDIDELLKRHNLETSPASKDIQNKTQVSLSGSEKIE